MTGLTGYIWDDREAKFDQTDFALALWHCHMWNNSTKSHITHN